MSAPSPLLVQTARLDLIASTIEHLRAELDTPLLLATLLGAEVPPSWPPGFYDRDAMALFLARLTEGGAAASGWYGWYAVRRADDGRRPMLVASGGYFGPPSADGTVEIGYSVVPEERGRGYAGELALALVERALALPGVQRVVAEAHESNTPSLRVLQRCGLVRVGPGRDPGYHRFERLPAPAKALE